jgi:hypothetical protein
VICFRVGLTIASSMSRTARGLAAVARRFGGAGAEADSVHPARCSGSLTSPQLECALVLRQSLGMRVDVVGGEPCLDGRREGARVVAGGVPVVREIGQQLRSAPAHRPMRIDRAADLAVQPHRSAGSSRS